MGSLEKIYTADKNFRFGQYFSIFLVASSLSIPLIEAVFQYFRLTITLFDWLVVFLYGLSLFFFFTAIEFNSEVQEKVVTEGDTSTKTVQTQTYTHMWTPLSQSCFWISGIIAILAISKTISLMWR